MTYSRFDNSQRPQALQCDARNFPADRIACAVGFSKTGTPSGISSALRMGPIIFFWHQAAECRACAEVRYAPQSICIVKTGTVHPPRNIGLSIVSPKSARSRNNNARNVNHSHGARQTTVKNPYRIANKIQVSA